LPLASQKRKCLVGFLSVSLNSLLFLWSIIFPVEYQVFVQDSVLWWYFLCILHWNATSVLLPTILWQLFGINFILWFSKPLSWWTKCTVFFLCCHLFRSFNCFLKMTVYNYYWKPSQWKIVVDNWKFLNIWKLYIFVVHIVSLCDHFSLCKVASHGLCSRETSSTKYSGIRISQTFNGNKLVWINGSLRSLK